MLAVDVSNQTGRRAPLAAARIAEVARAVLTAERVREAMLSIALLTPKQIEVLNWRYLRHHGATDVISFSFRRGAAEPAVVGDIYICPDVARANARDAGSGVREEVARLVVHGVLHVLGHDHPSGDDRTASAMWTRQERLLARVRRTTLER